MTIVATRTRAYGLWRAVAAAADGSQGEGWGLTETEAAQRARRAVAVSQTCQGCSRRRVPPAEAQVARRALGAVLCGTCRGDHEPGGER